ncbi:MAG: LytTR family DNA-binding domain-containing protein [Spirosomataceae bacterium]
MVTQKLYAPENAQEIVGQPSEVQSRQPVFSIAYDRATKEVLINDIVMLEGDGNYTFFHLSNGKRILVSRTLKQYEDALEGTSFLRVHKSFLVNLEHLVSYDLKNEMNLCFCNGAKVGVSRRKKQDVMGRLESMRNSLAS